MFANPQVGTDQTPGVFFRFPWENVDFLVRNGLYHPGPTRSPTTGTIGRSGMSSSSNCSLGCETRRHASRYSPAAARSSKPRPIAEASMPFSAAARPTQGFAILYFNTTATDPMVRISLVHGDDNCTLRPNGALVGALGPLTGHAPDSTDGMTVEIKTAGRSLLELLAESSSAQLSPTPPLCA